MASGNVVKGLKYPLAEGAWVASVAICGNTFETMTFGSTVPVRRPSRSSARFWSR
jgi:hypothetical protein